MTEAPYIKQLTRPYFYIPFVMCRRSSLTGGVSILIGLLIAVRVVLNGCSDGCFIPEKKKTLHQLYS